MDVIASRSSESKAEKSETVISDSRVRISPPEVDIPSSSCSGQRSICWFYSTYGTCKFGVNCYYSHIRPRKREEGKKNRKKSREKGGNSNRESKKESPSKVPSEISAVCRFFKASDCRIADPMGLMEFPTSDPLSQTVSFCYHELEQEAGIELDTDNASSSNTEESDLSTESNGVISSPTLVSNRGESLDLRETEIRLFKKRHPQHDHILENDEDIFEITFSSSDPDWAFSVKFIQLKVSLPITYPKEICDVKILDRKEEMPPFLIKFLNQSMQQWLLERHKSNSTGGKSELVLRPFFKWLDRNLENLFLEGLRKVKLHVEAEKAGFEFVPHELLPGAINNATSEKVDLKDVVPNKTEENNNISDPLCEPEADNSKCKDTNANICNSVQETCLALSQDTSVCSQKDNSCEIYRTSAKHGTEVKLIGLELIENVASLECQEISVSVICVRCKTPREFIASPKHCHSASCSKCHKSLQLTFQPSLLHQYSNVMGYLHLFDCKVVDVPLPQCNFLIDCLNCNRRNGINGIHYGQMLSTWCLFCNQKFCLILQACKFHQYQPSVKTGKLSVALPEKKLLKSKDIVIESGKPLPKIGTCKHYKKSHRWLRFPCCGKLYPCDICHNEAETGHEMKFASRMICGFCSKEQPYSTDRPCISCSTSLTKKSGKHWEGGKGCRDKIRMSRDDKHKYAGGSKTVSKKAAEQKPKKKV